MELAQIVQRIDELKTAIDHLRPIDREQEQRILQRFRLDWNYHSNAIEGNTLTYGETRAFLLHGITAQGKPFRDYLDIKGHRDAIEYLEEFVRQQHPLTEADIRELHRVLLVEPYEMPALTPEGLPTQRRIALGQYKTASNSVRTSTGEMHYYASPQETPALMGDLMQWYRTELAKAELHPVLVAATFHLRFVQIHPFDDGNGRMARLLMNLILMQAGYVPVVINANSKEEYLLALEKADVGEIDQFLILIGKNLIDSLQLFLRGAKGENIDDLKALDRRIELLQRQLQSEGLIPGVRSIHSNQLLVFENFIRPFLMRLNEKIDMLNPFFAKVSHSLGLVVSELRSSNLKPREDITDMLKEILQSRSDIRKVMIDYKFTNFLRMPQADLLMQLKSSPIQQRTMIEGTNLKTIAPLSP